MTNLVICWLYWIDLHQAFSLHGHTAVRRHQTLVLRTYSTPRRGWTPSWICRLGWTWPLVCWPVPWSPMQVAWRRGRNYHTIGNRPTMPMIQLPLLTIDLTADRGELTSFLFSLQTGELTFVFFSFWECFCRQETFHSHVSIALPSNRGTVMEMIAFVYLAWLSPFVQQSLFPSSVCVRINQGQKRG